MPDLYGRLIDVMDAQRQRETAPLLTAAVALGTTYLVNMFVRAIVWWGHSRLMFGEHGMAFSALLRFYIPPLVAWSNPPGMQIVPVLAFALAIVQGFTGKRFWSVRITVAILAFIYQVVLLRDYYQQKERLYLFGGAGVMIFALLLLSPWLTDLALRRFAELRRSTA